MKMVGVLIQMPQPRKARLDELRSQGYTASGYIRYLLERELTERQRQSKEVDYGRQSQ